MKKEIQNCLTWLANKTAEIALYSWDVAFKEKQIKEAFAKFIEEIKKHIDFSTITIEEAIALRFGKWDEELPNLYLFPLYLVPLIPEGLEVIDLDGTETEYDSNLADNDTLSGCVPFGINILK